MFTGIITDIGTIIRREELAKGRLYEVQTSYDTSSIDIGASIAHAGVCLTVTQTTKNTYVVEAWEEALRLTNAKDWDVGSKLNLERALKIGDELGGHIVSGHVDGMAKITDLQDEGDALRFTFDVPQKFAPFVAPKGSVGLNGTSFTVNEVNGTKFDVLIIRHTLEVTTWGISKVNDDINFEIDTMARYAARLSEFSDK